jgi:PQQ-like domain
MGVPRSRSGVVVEQLMSPGGVMRRFISRTLLVAPFILLAAAVNSTAGAATHPPAPWAQNDYNGAQSRANLIETILTPSSVRQIHYLRSITAPPQIDRCFSGIQAPVTTGGNIYEVEAGLLTARTAATGQKLWVAPSQTPAADFGNYSVAVTNGTVLFANSDCESETNAQAYIEAHNATSGNLTWRHPLDGGVSDVVVSGSYVVAEADDAIGGGADTVTALRIADGSVAWSATCAGFRHVVIVAQNVIYRCSSDDQTGDDTVVARHLATGTQAWAASAGQILRGDSDATSGAHVYILRSGVVDDVNPVTGQTRFTLPGATSVLAVDRTRVYASCPAGVCAYAVATGAQVWATSPENNPMDIRTASEANGVLYLGNGDVLNASNGAFITELFQGGSSGSTPTFVAGGRVGVMKDDRILDLYGLAGS